MMKLSIGYPSKEDELRMASRFLTGEAASEIRPVMTTEDVLRIREDASKVTVSEKVISYAEEIIHATRTTESLALGASPRAFLQLAAAARAEAWLDGRDYVNPDDIKSLAMKVLPHRLVLSSEARIRRDQASDILRTLIGRIRVPV